MKLLFAGTPDIAARVLSGLIPFAQAHQHEIVAVLTQPDRPSGRGQHLVKSPVKQLTEVMNIPVLQPLSLSAKKDPLIQETLKNLKPDLMIVTAYGLILPQAVLDIPRFGCWNIHVSLLPRWRGAAPIQRAIEAGDVSSGVTLMQMDKGLDTGDILVQESCPIYLTDNAGMLHDRLADLGLEALKKTLSTLSTHQNDPTFSLPREVQDHPQATYAEKIDKAEGQIDWSKPAMAIHHKIMAFNPWPVCFSSLGDLSVRIWKSMPTYLSRSGEPGTLLSFEKNKVGVIAGDQKILELIEIQLPGKKSMPGKDFLNGYGDQCLGKVFA